MTGGDEELSMKAIEMVRNLGHSLAAKCGEQGLSLEDTAIGFAHATFDIAEILTGSRIAAVEWLRTVADQIELQVMAEDDDMIARPGKKPN